jgi:FkbM family methyltransferase
LADPVAQKSRRRLITFYNQLITAGDLCFDIGANVGNRTDVFLALGARVVCVEPQPKCVDILTEKYRDNTQVVVVPKGVAAQPGIKSLYLCESASTIATFSEKWRTGRFRDYRWESTVDVPVTTLDALIQEFGVPAFCKIDVEGFEYQVLRGLSCLIPVLSFEFTKEFINDAKLCMKYLTSIGFVEFNYALGESMTLALSQWTDANTVLDCLGQITDDLLWGDIYTRFQSSQ